MGSIKPVKFRDREMVRDGLLYPSAGALLARAIKVSIGLALTAMHTDNHLSFTWSAQDTASKNLFMLESSPERPQRR